MQGPTGTSTYLPSRGLDYPGDALPDDGRPPDGGGAAIEITEKAPGVEARLAWLAARLTVRPVLAVGSHLPRVPWPFGLVDFAARAVPWESGAVRCRVRLPRCKAHLVRSAGVSPADAGPRAVLYLHGGAFVTCGANTHGRLATSLSKYADCPVLVVDYRMIPKHSIEDALDDCYDGYRWLRRRGYQPAQIVLAGDSAGGYLSLALAERLLDEGEQPAAMVAMSPLLQIVEAAGTRRSVIDKDAMLPPKAFEALVGLVGAASRRGRAHGRPVEVFEPLEHIEPGLPPTLIHVSGSEALLHDARLGAELLAAAGVPVEVRIWPGQVHVFQIGVPFVPEATRSLRQIGEYIRKATPDCSDSVRRIGETAASRNRPACG